MLKKYSHNRIVYYGAFTLAFGFIWYLFKLGGYANFTDALFSAGIDVAASLLVLFVTTEVLLPRLFYNQQYLLFAFCFFVLAGIAGLCTVILQLKLSGYVLSDYQKPHHQHFYYWFWSDLVFGSYFLILFIALGGFVLRLSFERVMTAKRMANLEKERGQAELEALKNQINPHFLFNAINTIYYKIDRGNVEARSLVDRFSTLLRYQLYECNEAMVDIKNELKFIGDYIELQKERLDDNVSVTFKRATDDNGFFIAPFILMPMVENCFKHVSHDAVRENKIDIRTGFEAGWFYLETANTAKPVAADVAHGIGLSNVKRRLDLIYPGNYMLEFCSSGEMFNLVLKIKV